MLWPSPHPILEMHWCLDGVLQDPEEDPKRRWTEVNHSLSGLSPKSHPRGQCWKWPGIIQGKEGGNSVPAEREGHSLGADVTPQSRDMSPGCSLWLKKEACSGRGSGGERKGSTVSGRGVLSHRRQCCTGSEAEACWRELWGHFWDSDGLWPHIPAMLTAHTLSR